MILHSSLLAVAEERGEKIHKVALLYFNHRKFDEELLNHII